MEICELCFHFDECRFIYLPFTTIYVSNQYKHHTRHSSTFVSRLCRIHFTAALNVSDLGEPTVLCLHIEVIDLEFSI